MKYENARTYRNLSNLLILIVLLFGQDKSIAAPIFMGIGDLPGGESASGALGISADGSTVVGSSKSGNGTEAFSWSEVSGIRPLGDLSGGPFESVATSASFDGTVLAGRGHTGVNFGITWNHEIGPQSIGQIPGPGSGSAAFGISDDGNVIVGSSISVQGNQAARWVGGQAAHGLGDLPGGAFRSRATAISGDGSVVVGNSETGDGTEAFRWTESGGMTGLGDLPGGTVSSSAQAASLDGSVIVGLGHQALGDEAFRWTATNGMLGLQADNWPGWQSWALDVSANGNVVVGRLFKVSPMPIRRAFIWDSQYGMRDLQTILEIDFGLDLSGWNLTQATGISADGLTITGTGTNPSGFGEAWIVRIPEPSTAILLTITGLACVWIRRVQRP